MEKQIDKLIRQIFCSTRKYRTNKAFKRPRVVKMSCRKIRKRETWSPDTPHQYNSYSLRVYDKITNIEHV